MNVLPRIEKTHAEIALAEMYEALAGTLPGGAGVTARRRAAIEAFARSGLPTSRQEAWHYTDLRQLMTTAQPPAPHDAVVDRTAAATAGAALAGLGYRRLVIVDGVLDRKSSDLSDLEPGLTIRSTAAALAADEPVLEQRLGDGVPENDAALMLNTAFAGDGAVLSVASGASIERPVHLAFVTTGRRPSASYTRSLAIVGAGARLALVESHEGPDDLGYQTNTTLQIVGCDSAGIEHVRIIDEGSRALHIGTLLAHLGSHARFRSLGFIRGGAIVRNQQFVRLGGEATNAAIHGVSLLSDRQHADVTLTVDHAMPGSESTETFKAVVDERARSVFQGRIIVRQAAQHTDARMSARALLLSDEARADAKPELEIFADDVRCGHGATAGPLDDQMIFYLMARGIPEHEAKGLLVQAFAGEVLDKVFDDGLRGVLLANAARWLGKH